jgi:hypothetical protein
MTVCEYRNKYTDTLIRIQELEGVFVITEIRGGDGLVHYRDTYKQALEAFMTLVQIDQR